MYGPPLLSNTNMFLYALDKPPERPKKTTPAPRSILWHYAAASKNKLITPITLAAGPVYVNCCNQRMRFYRAVAESSNTPQRTREWCTVAWVDWLTRIVGRRTEEPAHITIRLPVFSTGVNHNTYPDTRWVLAKARQISKQSLTRTRLISTLRRKESTQWLSSSGGTTNTSIAALVRHGIIESTDDDITEGFILRLVSAFSRTPADYQVLQPITTLSSTKDEDSRSVRESLRSILLSITQKQRRRR